MRYSAAEKENQFKTIPTLGLDEGMGSGLSVTFEKDGRRAYFHRPHPQREALRYRVKAVREFLAKLEITP